MADFASNGLDENNICAKTRAKLFITQGRNGQPTSLEDLLNLFDETLDSALGELTKNVIQQNCTQIHSQQELVRDDPIWRSWFGNSSSGVATAVDWSQSLIHKQFSLPFTMSNHQFSRCDSLTEDEQLPIALEESVPVFSPGSINLNQHMLSAYASLVEVPSSDDVLREIDQIMNEEPQLKDKLRAAACNSAISLQDDQLESVLSAMEDQLKSLTPVYADKLKDMDTAALSDLSADLEKVSQQLSKILVHALAEREELGYIKEVRNDFISALLAVNSKKKQVATTPTNAASSATNKRKSKSSYNLFEASFSPPDAPSIPTSVSILSMTTPRQFRQAAERKARDAISSIVNKNQNKYLRTTIIPYLPSRALTTQHIHALIEILQAMMTENPLTPKLLTEYILNLVCPRV